MLLDSFETKEKILQEFLKISALEDWSEASLEKAAKNCAISEENINLIFENGCLDLADFYIEYYNQKLVQEIKKIENFHQQKIRDKIRLVLYLLIEVEKSNQISLQRLSNFYLNLKNFTKLEIGPRPALHGLKSCYKVSDFIWKEINDQSTDFNFYTKRLILAKIILCSFFVFVKDDSENFIKTKNFIDLQIAKVMKFEKQKARIKQVFGSAFMNSDAMIKSPKEFVKNLPFFRLIKFK